MSSKGPSLSECADSFRRAIDDPFGADDVCLPSGFIIPPSRKLKIWAAGTMQAPVGANGFILVRPLLGACNDSVSVSDNFVTYSAGTYAGSTMVVNTATTGVTYLVSNSPHASSDFSSSGMRVRLVSCGLELWNDTAMLNREGSIYGVVDPDHASLDTLNAGAILNYESSFQEGSASGKKIMLKWDGVKNTSELDYEYDFASGTAQTLQPCMGVISSPGVSSAQIYRFRVVAHYELIGRQVPGKTDNWADPIGSSVIMNAAAATPRNTNHSSNTSEWRHLFSDFVSRGLHSMYPTLRAVAPTALAAGMSYITGNPTYLSAAIARPPSKEAPKQIAPKKSKKGSK